MTDTDNILSDQSPELPSPEPTQATLREAIFSLQTDWELHSIRMPKLMWRKLEEQALVEGRQQTPPRPKSVNSVVLGMLLRGIEEAAGRVDAGGVA